MAASTKVAYTRLDLNQLPPKPVVLKIVLPLIIGFFVLFCFIGYLSPQPAPSHMHQRRRHPQSQTSLNESELMNELKSLLKCKSVDDTFRIETRGDFWVLKNFITPKRERQLECYETITYTTHGDYRFMENIIPLLDRWQAPLSVAIYAPGEEFVEAIAALRALFYCHRQSYLVEENAAVHLYFDFDRMPPNPIQFYRDLVHQPFNCPSSNANSAVTQEKPTSNHTYPVNVGRNIARDASQTHFVLASDIELYPNPGFIDMFLRMIAHPVYHYTLEMPSVYVLPIFEVTEISSVPEDKTELLQMVQNGEAIKFHEKICSSCHTVPNYHDWLRVVKTDQTMDILVTSKKEGQFKLWEPIYVGTKKDPQYEERMSWEGKFDKMTQGYIMCVLDYNFHVLDNGFLVHKPGIKSVSEAARPELEKKQRKFVEETVFEELKVLYGVNDRCSL